MFTSDTALNQKIGSMKAADRWERHDSLPHVMESEAEDFLKRLEALHVGHFGEGSKFAAGEKLTHADYYTLVIFDYMSHELGYEELIQKCAPNLLNCVARTKSNPLLVDYLEENKDNVFVGMGFIF